MDTKTKARNTGVTLRAVLLALLLIPIDNFWITIIEVRWYTLDGTSLPLFITPIFILFILVLVNLGLRRYLPRAALARGELLTIYTMTAMGATLASHDLMQNLFGAIGYPHYFATDSNHYESTFFRYLPDHLLVSDKLALKGFYRGGVDPWNWQIMKHWIGPLAWWGALMFVLIGMMMCINIIIRKQWTEHEKLSFPLIQLPMAMTSDQTERFYSNKFMWGGFALAAVIGLVNGLHSLYPSLPWVAWVKQYNLGIYFPDRPWSALQVGINGFQIAAYPFAIGLAYFMPLDLSFSCWFFFVARKAWQVFGAAMGWDSGAGNAFPYCESQSTGAWLALGVSIIIGSMPYIKSVWRQSWREAGTPEEAAEASLYRKAFYGLGIGFMLLYGFMRYAGMTVWPAMVFIAIYFLLVISITRVRAELGTPHEFAYVSPQHIMIRLFGYNMLGPANLTALATLFWFNRCNRSNPMPAQLEAFKMAEGTSIKPKSLVFALMLAVVVGIISTYYANLSICYRDGAEAKCLGFKWWLGTESFQRLQDWMTNKPGPEPISLAYVAAGAATIVVLSMLRGAFVGWPFHPAGYALAVSFAIDYFWFAIFLSWLVKLVIVRYGGMKLHQKLVPFFLGLVLGDFFIGSVWALIAPMMGQQTYRVFI